MRALAATLLSVALLLPGLALLGAASASATASMLGQVNAARAKHGEAALAWNAHLASVAKAQADRMADKRKLYHNPNLARDVGNYRWVGENVGYGPDADTIQKAFMDSPGHRANILDGDFTQIGIGQTRDGKGRLWIAQVFRKPAGSTGGTKAAAPKPSTTKKSTKAKPAKPTKPTAPRATRKPTTKASSSARKPTTTPTRTPVARTPVAKRPAWKKPVSRTTATPQPTLAQRVAFVQQSAPTGAGDPVAGTLAFAAAMNAVAG